MSDSTTSRSFCVYKISNSINGKLYIGVTSRTLQVRWAQHLEDVNTPRLALHRAMKKYGIEHFSIELVEECPDRQTMLEREKYWIQHYHCMTPNGYNITAGGEGISGYRLTEEHRKIVSEANKKRIQTLRQQQRRREIAFEHKIWLRAHEANRGRVISEATRQKKRLASLGRRHSDATKEKLRQIRTGSKRTYIESEETKRKRFETRRQRGYWHSTEARQKMSETRKGRKGRPHTEEELQKMRLAQIGRTHSEETKQKIREARLRYWQQHKSKEETA